MHYKEAFRAEMVRKMLGPSGVSPASLSKETGVSQATFWRWLKEARQGKGTMANEKTSTPKRWTVTEKVRALAAAEGLEGEQLGALLRQEGLHEAQLKMWREAVSGALDVGAPPAVATRREVAGMKVRIKQLEKELRRKERALAETAALLVLEKKLQALGWDSDDEAGNTTERSER